MADTYDEVVAEVARDLDIDEAALRATFEEWLRRDHGVRRQMLRDGRMTHLDDARCYAVYRLTKSASAFNMAQRTIERRTPTPEQREQAKIALLRYMEWWSENYYAAGWLTSLAATMKEHGDPTYLWLCEVAGGTYDNRETFVESEDE